MRYKLFVIYIIIEELRDIDSELPKKKKTELRDIKLELRYINSQFREKNQKRESDLRDNNPELLGLNSELREKNTEV